jgi:TRAP-type uncharacterized transport system fused permease subunit
MWVGSIIYFLPFFFVMNPALVMQAIYLEAVGLMGLAGIGTLFICGGIQGYQAFVGDLRKAGALEWPIRVLLVIGGFVSPRRAAASMCSRNCRSRRSGPPSSRRPSCLPWR